MKLAVVGIAAFVVGIAGGTVLSPARTAVPVDTTHAEAGADDHAEGGGDAAGIDTSHGAPLDPIDAGVSHDPSAAESHDEAPSGTDEIQSISAAVAKLSAADAGPMVARLSDAEALAVLKSLPLAQASKILDTMPEEKAARLSKQLLLAGTTP